MSLESLIAEVNRRGLQVSNLMQLADGTWQSNLRDSIGGYEFARGPTPDVALQRAIDKAASTLKIVPIPEKPKTEQVQPKGRIVIIRKSKEGQHGQQGKAAGPGS